MKWAAPDFCGGGTRMSAPTLPIFEIDLSLRYTKFGLHALLINFFNSGHENTGYHFTVPNTIEYLRLSGASLKMILLVKSSFLCCLPNTQFMNFHRCPCSARFSSWVNHAFIQSMKIQFFRQNSIHNEVESIKCWTRYRIDVDGVLATSSRTAVDLVEGTLLSLHH